ncbi:DUF7266 family protein [Halorubrum trueperi]|uniref:Secreted glycoprotein n=1 Tax=Halorubrum trueperi TaxID=2004704 RepID=A0ABD5UJE6_9EURY
MREGDGGSGGRSIGGRSPVGFAGDDRAVSVTVGYVLTLAIGAIVLSGVVMGVGGVIDAQTQRTVEGDLSVAGQTVVANLESADRLARAAAADRPESEGNVTVSVEVDVPDRVAGTGYRIEIDDDAEAVVVRTDRPDARVEIPYAATRDVESTTVTGGPLRITYAVDDGEAGPGTLEVTER